GRGALVDELTEILTWVRAGVREGDAFRRAAELTPCREAARTYHLFAAGAERGSDLASGLLAVSDDLRHARRPTIRPPAVRPSPPAARRGADARRCSARRSGPSPRSCCCSSPRRCPRSSSGTADSSVEPSNCPTIEPSNRRTGRYSCD